MIEKTSTLNTMRACSLCHGEIWIVDGKRERHTCKLPSARVLKTVLMERERELLELKGPCTNWHCPLHKAHSGPCAKRQVAPTNGGFEAKVLIEVLGTTHDIGILEIDNPNSSEVLMGLASGLERVASEIARRALNGDAS